MKCKIHIQGTPSFLLLGIKISTQNLYLRLEVSNIFQNKIFSEHLIGQNLNLNFH
jgi:hypothetical protein